MRGIGWLLVIAFILRIGAAWAQNTDPAKIDPVEEAEAFDPSAVALELIDRARAPDDAKKHFVTVRVVLKNTTGKEQGYELYARLSRAEGNLVDVGPLKIIPGPNLIRLGETKPADLFQELVPLVQTIDSHKLDPGQELTFGLEIPFKPLLDRANFPCENRKLGVFSLRIVGTTRKGRPNGDFPVGAPICINVETPVHQFTKEELVSLGSLHFENALIQKTRADELFLLGATQDAAKKYGEAQSSLDTARSFEMEDKTVAAGRLLEADILYRLTLLDLNIDFWGGYRTGTPGVPLRHLIALEGLVKEFEKVVNQMDVAYNFKVGEEAELLKAKAALQEVTGKLNAFVAEKEKAVISERKERRIIDIGWSELRDIQSQQVQIARRLDMIASMQKSLTSQANKLLTNAVARSAGVDPSLVEGVRTGKVDQLVKSYIASQVGDPNSELMKQVESFSKDSEEFVALYSRAKKAKEEIEGLKGHVEFAAEAIRKPSLERLQQLGARILNELPENEKKAFIDKVRVGLPAKEWIRSAEDAIAKVDSARQAARNFDVRTIVAKELARAQIPVDELRQVVYGVRDRVLSQGNVKGPAEIDAMAKTLLGQISRASGTASDVRAALISVVQALPESAAKQWPSEVKGLLKAHLGIQSDEELVSRLQQGALGQISIAVNGLDMVTLQSDAVKGQVRVQKSKLLGELSVGQRSIDKAASDLTTLLDSVLTQAPQLSEVVLANLPTESLTGAVVRFDKSIDKAGLSGRIQAYLGQEGLLEAATENGTQKVVGAAYANDLFNAVPSTNDGLDTGATEEMPAETSDDASQGGMDPATSAAVTLALDAAFPGAGTVLQMALTFSSMEANRGIAEKLAAEGARLMARKNELVDRQSERYADALLAEAEQRRAEALAEASNAQISTFQASMRTAVEEADIQRARLGVRRGWAFYLAERMREEFDLFDRSFALWARGKAQRGVVEQEIRNDPQNVRYALDSQIQLFDWLDRSRESSKTDPDFLRVHWSRMLRLAKDLCQKQGCKPGDNLLGQVGNSREVSVINELLSARDRVRFREWQRNPSGPFIAEFQITPIHRVVPAAIQNVRLIDVRLSRRGNGSSELATGADHISLSHSGVSYIGVSNVAADNTIDYHLETMLPRTSSSFNLATEFDLEALRGRYDGYFRDSNLPSSRTFEGYGLLATYGLRVEPTSANLSAKDVIFRAAYFYQESDMIQSEAAFVRRAMAGKETKLSAIFPELSPFVLVVGSDTNACKLPTDEEDDRALFERNDYFPANSYEAVAFFGGRPVRQKLSGKRPQVTAMQGKIDALEKCGRAELRPMCKPFDAVVERARSLGAQMDGDPSSLDRRAELNIPSGTSYRQALPRLVEKEYIDQGCEKEGGPWLERRSLFTAR
jgi:hypothetical protein